LLCTSLVCFGTLFFKRFASGGELGGTGLMRFGLSLALGSLWVVFIALSGMEAMGTIKGFTSN
jgi:hypothetical protein